MRGLRVGASSGQAPTASTGSSTRHVPYTTTTSCEPSPGVRLDPEVHQRLDGLLADDGTGAAFTRLAADPGRVGLESLLAEIDKQRCPRARAAG